jgi:hypothetical protein
MSSVAPIKDLYILGQQLMQKSVFYRAPFLTKLNKRSIKKQYNPPKFIIKIILYAFHRYYAIFTSILDVVYWILKYTSIKKPTETSMGNC